jgi:hypothetical protein
MTKLALQFVPAPSGTPLVRPRSRASDESGWPATARHGIEHVRGTAQASHLLTRALGRASEDQVGETSRPDRGAGAGNGTL